MERPERKVEIVKATPTKIEPAYNKAIALTAQHYQTMVAFVRVQMQKEVDYGIIPGTKKPTLLKPGAEKRCDPARGQRALGSAPSKPLVRSSMVGTTT